MLKETQRMTGTVKWYNEKKGVLLMPSTQFNYGTSHFRIGFGRKNLPDALQHFDNYMTEYYD